MRWKISTWCAVGLTVTGLLGAVSSPTAAHASTVVRPPTQVAAAHSGDRAVRVSWHRSTTSSVARYVVYDRHYMNHALCRADSWQSSCRVTGLNPTVGYRFKVIAVNSRGVESSPSLPTEPIRPWATRPPFGRGMTGPVIASMQTRLSWAGLWVARTGYFNASTQAQVQHLQEKFLYDQTGTMGSGLWDFLRHITWRRGELPWQCSDFSLCITKDQRIMRFIVDGQVVRTVDVRFGTAGDPTRETREGLFQVNWKDRDHYSTVWGSPMPFTMNFAGGQAIHYSYNFADIGYWGSSHGCINVRDWDALEWIYDRTPVGTPVYVYW